MTPRRTVAALVGFVLVLAFVGCGATTSTRGSGSPGGELFTKDTCADLVVLGLRGSAQSPTTYSGVGEEVYKSVRAMAKRVRSTSKTSMRVEGVPYPAASPPTFVEYLASVRQGQRQLAATYSKLVSACPHTKIALTGFSQGAHAVHQFAHDLSASLAKPLVLVALIGDPRRNPDDTIHQWFYSSERPTGRGKDGVGPRFNAATRKTAISFCVAGDEVCGWRNADAAAGLSATHRTFYEKQRSADSTGAQMYALVRRSLD
ncbi:MAG: hypothetical protein JWP10_755 [Nocardioidaceae bacterium]|nr:hypothetical protein [Nocardioidaceae bacterium]